MSFISYAQNLEDVMLWRALKDINIGFYVDVGANDPVNDSVTMAFYNNGWSGINIEPVQHWFKLLEQNRPRDTNLQLAVGNLGNSLSIYEVKDTGLSTTIKDVAQKHIESGFEVSTYYVPSRKLDDVLDEYNPKDIHFLKIDVEGAEKTVLESIDFIKHRPWIIVIEATEPNSSKENYSEWETILLVGNYNFVYFDGLNRFYLANERNHLQHFFQVPPNFFDHYIRHSEEWAIGAVERLQKQNDLLVIDLNSLQERLKEIYSGKIWRLMSILTKVKNIIGKLI